MESIKLPNGRMPILGVGTLSISDDACTDNVLAALGIGYRHIDTAQAYRNEAGVGRAIARSGLARTELFVTTKLWMTDYAPDKVRPSIEASLERLGLDYVDLMLMHWPAEETPMEQTLGVLMELRKAGRLRDIGVSNFTKAMVERAQDFTGGLIACNQVECHVFLRQDGLRATHSRLGVATVAYSPLARGKIADEPVVAEIAKRHGRTPAQVAVRWLLQNGIVAIPKSATPARLAENFKVFDFELGKDDLARIATIPTARMINPKFAPAWDAD